MNDEERKELRDKLRALPRTERTDPRYPIDAYEDDLVALIEYEVAAALSKRRFGAMSDQGIQTFIDDLKFEQQRRKAGDERAA